MNARLERKLRLLAAIIVGSVIGSVGFVLARGSTSAIGIEIGVLYGLLLGFVVGGISQFVLEGPMRGWLGSLSFTASLMVRSAIYAAIFVPVLFFQVGDVIAGNPSDPLHKNFWTSFAYSFVLAILLNLIIEIANIIGPRAFLNLVTGRYHFPVEENRFVLFVDIAGSTGLAERLGGVAIHRLLDRTFRLLTQAVVDYRGEVLNYVGDEVIVTWRELEQEFGAVPRIRGSLHFGPVIVGEIGDVKRAIVFNGDVMNTAARLEELSRTVEGGFLASRTAMEQFNSAPPFAVRDLGRLPIRGRADGIDVIGIDDRNGTAESRPATRKVYGGR
jgi:adenylate cyclase